MKLNAIPGASQPVSANRKFSLFALLLAACALVTIPVGVLGATFTFTGAAENPTSWFNITNWSPRAVPGVSDTIIVPGGSVGIPDGVYSNVLLTGGTLEGTFSVGGALVWSAGNLSGSVTVRTNAVLTLAFTSAGTTTGVITNHGRIVWPAGSYPAWGFKDGRLENAADGVVDAQVDFQFHNFGGTAQINNAGVMTKSAGTSVGEFRLGVGFLNTGTVDLQKGGASFQDGFISRGTFTVATGAKLDLNAGLFRLQSGHRFTGSGDYGVLGGRATIDGPINDANFQLANGLMTISNQLTGTLVWKNGTLVGELTIATNGLLNLSMESAGTVTGVITNHGRIVWPAGSYPAWGFKDGRLENAADGVLDAQVDFQFHNFGGTAQINNAGVMTKSAGTAVGEFRLGVGFLNTGLVDLQKGGASFQDGFISRGTFTVATGAKLDLNAGLFRLQSGHRFTGSGDYGVLGGRATIDGPINDANFQLASGIMTISNQLTGTLVWKNGTLVGELTIATNGLLNLSMESAGTVTGVITNRGRIIWPAGSYPAWGFKDGRLENAADGVLDAQVDFQFHNFGGTAQINNAGLIRKSAGVAVGEFRLGVGFLNTGTVDLQKGGASFQDGFISRGTFTVATGAKLDLNAGVFRLQAGHRFTGGGDYGVLGGRATIDGPIKDANFQLGSGIMTISNQLTGTLVWKNGTLVGELTIATNGLLNLSMESAGTVTGVITNHGRIVWSVGSYPAWGFQDGRLENAADGVLDAQVDFQFHNFGGTAQINNAGLISKSAGTSVGEFRLGVGFLNTGTVDLQKGGVSFLDGFTSRGALNVATGGRIDLNAGVFRLQAGHRFTGGGDYGVLGGRATIDGPIKDANFQLANGTMTISNQLTGGLVWRNGTLVGQLTIGNSGVLNLSLQAAGTVNGVITNHGRIVWPVGSYPALGFQDGRLENAADGFVDAQLDFQFHNFGGTAQINNAGVLSKSGGTAAGEFRSGVGFLNTGLLEALSGEVQLPADYIQRGGQLNIGIQSPLQYGRITFAGAASLAGNLTVVPIGGFRPALGDSFDVLRYPSRTGQFGAVTLPPVLDGQWDVVYGATVLTLRINAGHPRLVASRNANDLSFTWPASAGSAFALQTTATLAPPIKWVTVTNAVTLSGGQFGVVIPMRSGQAFYRLQQ